MAFSGYVEFERRGVFGRRAETFPGAFGYCPVVGGDDYVEEEAVETESRRVATLWRSAMLAVGKARKLDKTNFLFFSAAEFERLYKEVYPSKISEYEEGFCYLVLFPKNERARAKMIYGRNPGLPSLFMDSAVDGRGCFLRSSADYKQWHVGTDGFGVPWQEAVEVMRSNKSLFFRSIAMAVCGGTMSPLEAILRTDPEVEGWLVDNGGFDRLAEGLEYLSLFPKEQVIEMFKGLGVSPLTPHVVALMERLDVKPIVQRRCVIVGDSEDGEDYELRFLAEGDQTKEAPVFGGTWMFSVDYPLGPANLMKPYDEVGDPTLYSDDQFSEPESEPEQLAPSGYGETHDVSPADVSGFCYVNMFPLSARNKAVHRCGRSPGIGVVMTAMEEANICEKGYNKVKIDLVEGGMLHVEADEGSDVNPYERFKHWYGIDPNMRVGAFRICSHLGAGSWAAPLCEDCERRRPIRKESCSHCPGSDEAVDLCAFGTVGDIDIVASIGLLRNEGCFPEFLERKQSCVLPQDTIEGATWVVEAPFVRVLVPPGYGFDIPSVGVSVQPVAGWVQLVAVGRLEMRLHHFPVGKGLCVMKGFFEDRVAVYHKYFGEDPADTFARFSTIAGFPVVVSARTFPVVRDSSHASDLFSAGSVHVVGDVDSSGVEKMELLQQCLDLKAGLYGTGVYSGDADCEIGLVTKKGKIPLSIILREDRGLLLTRRVENISGIYPEGVGAVVSGAEDDYLLDAGGPSDDEFPDEF